MTTDQALGDAAARGSGVTLAAQGLRILLHFTSIFILARLLDPADFGLVAMVVAIVGVSEILRDLGLSMAAVQAPTLSPGQKTNLFWINAGVGLLFAGAIFALATPIAFLYREPALLAVTHSIAAVYLFNGLSAQFRAELNRKLHFVRLSSIDVAAQVLGLALAVVVALSGGGYWALVAQTVAYSSLGLIFAVVLSRWWPGLPKRGEPMRQLIRFGLSVTGTQAIDYVVASSATIALGIAWGPTVTGLYNRSAQLVVAPFSQLAAPLTRVAVPVLSRSWAARPHTFQALLDKAQLIGLYGIVPVYCLMFGLAGPISTIALGPGWDATVPILQALSIGGIFRGLTQLTYWAYLSRGRAVDQLKIHLLFQPLIVACTLAGLPWGAVGVASGFSTGLALYWVVSLFAAGRILDIEGARLFRRAVRGIVTLSVPLILIGLICQKALPGAILPVLMALVLTVFYAAGLAALSTTSRSDFVVLGRFARRAVRR